MGAEDELVAGQRVAEEDRVGARGIQGAVGLIGQREGPERGAAVELERGLAAELDAQAGTPIVRRGCALEHRDHRSPDPARLLPVARRSAGGIVERGSDSCDLDPKVNVLFDFTTLMD